MAINARSASALFFAIMLLAFGAAGPSQAQPAPARPVSSAGAVAPAVTNTFVGTWVITSPGQSWRTIVVLSANGSLRDDNGYTGRWRQAGNRLFIDFDVGTHYDGVLANGVVNGNYTGGGSGRFVMVRG